jgi:hypothetical protein
MLNFVLIFEQQALCWRTVPLKYGKAAAILFPLIKKTILDYEAKLGVKTVCVVADNEATNRSTLKTRLGRNSFDRKTRLPDASFNILKTRLVTRLSIPEILKTRLLLVKKKCQKVPKSEKIWKFFSTTIRHK